MKNKKYKAKIEYLDVRHYSRRNLTHQCAKMSLWAGTDLGHEVWLFTDSGLDTRRINTKVAEMEKKYSFMLGQEIEYIVKKDWTGEEQGIGFLRPRTEDLEEYRERAKPEYLDMGAGI